jgi:hypothetical protein
MTFVLKGRDDQLAGMLEAITAIEGVDSYAVSCELPARAPGPRARGGGGMLPLLVGLWALAAAAGDVGAAAGASLV